MDRVDRVQLLLRLTEDEGHWYLDNQPVDAADLRDLDGCTAEDFDIALAILDAAAVDPVRDFTLPAVNNFFQDGFSRWNLPPSDVQRFRTQQEQMRLSALEVLTRREVLRRERDRRWP